MKPRFSPGDKVAVISKGEHFGVILECHGSKYKVWGMRLDDEELIDETEIIPTQVQVPSSWLDESVGEEKKNELYEKGLIY